VTSFPTNQCSHINIMLTFAEPPLFVILPSFIKQYTDIKYYSSHYSETILHPITYLELIISANTTNSVIFNMPEQLLVTELYHIPDILLPVHLDILYLVLSILVILFLQVLIIAIVIKQ